MSDALGQVDYRSDPSFGGEAAHLPAASYDNPIDGTPVSPQVNQSNNPDNSETFSGLKQPQLFGYSPDEERQRSGFGRD